MLVVILFDFKEALRVSTNRAGCRSFFANYDVAAVCALPDNVSVLAEDLFAGNVVQ